MLGSTCTVDSDCSSTYPGLSCINIDPAKGSGICDCDEKNVHAGYSCAEGKVCANGPPKSLPPPAPGPSPGPAPGPSAAPGKGKWITGGPNPGKDNCDGLNAAVNDPKWAQRGLYDTTVKNLKTIDFSAAGNVPFICQNGANPAGILGYDLNKPITGCQGASNFSCIWSDPSGSKYPPPPPAARQ